MEPNTLNTDTRTANVSDSIHDIEQSCSVDAQQNFTATDAVMHDVLVKIKMEIDDELPNVSESNEGNLCDFVKNEEVCEKIGDCWSADKHPDENSEKQKEGVISHESMLVQDDEVNSLPKDTTSIAQYDIMKASRQRRPRNGLPRETYQTFYYCMQCKEAIGNKKGLHKHREAHKGIADSEWRAFQCPTCMLVFLRPQEAISHREKLHGLKRQFVCGVCGVAYHRKKYYFNHRLTHNSRRQKITCDQCGITCATRQVLRRHMTLHNQDAPYKCDICQKRFKSVDRLKSHVRSHLFKQEGSDMFDAYDKNCVEASERLGPRIQVTLHPTECETCKKKFRDKHLLEIHKNRFHGNKMSVFCNECGANFKSIDRLRNHITYTHGSEKFACSICKRIYTCQLYLERHMELHYTRQKQHVCTICSDSFSHQNALVAHMKAHNEHSGGTHFCTSCNARFGSKMALTNHVKKAHLGMPRLTRSWRPPSHHIENQSQPMQNSPVNKLIDARDNATDCSDTYFQSKLLRVKLRMKCNKQAARKSFASSHIERALRSSIAGNMKQTIQSEETDIQQTTTAGLVANSCESESESLVEKDCVNVSRNADGEYSRHSRKQRYPQKLEVSQSPQRDNVFRTQSVVDSAGENNQDETLASRASAEGCYDAETAAHLLFQAATKTSTSLVMHLPPYQAMNSQQPCSIQAQNNEQSKSTTSEKVDSQYAVSVLGRPHWEALQSSIGDGDCNCGKAAQLAKMAEVFRKEMQAVKPQDRNQEKLGTNSQPPRIGVKE